VTTETTPITTVAPIRVSASAATRLLLAQVAGDLVSAALAVVVVSSLGGELTAYHAGPLALGWVVVQAPRARRSPLDGRVEQEIRVIRGATVAALACFVAAAVLQLPAAPLLGFIAVATVCSLLARSIPLGAATSVQTLVLGEPQEAAAVAAGLAQSTGGSLVAAAVCTPAELPEILRSTAIDLVLAVPGPGLSDRALQRVGWHLEGEGIPLAVGTRLADVAATRARLARIGALNVLHLAPARRRGFANELKAVWERSAAAALLLVLAPLLIAIVIAIRLDSPGPAIFRQRRVGLGGDQFTMLKFRTMHVDAEQRLAELREQCDEMLFKLRDDPRITRCGRLLRRYSLDELPQLVNVVRGDMALVGPRPALPEEVAAYDEDPRHRLVVKPGLTGLWQVSGRSDLSWDETVRLDLDYVDNWSIGRDLAILFRTVGAVLGHRGAY